jgi:hypothetical protein
MLRLKTLCRLTPPPIPSSWNVTVAIGELRPAEIEGTGTGMIEALKQRVNDDDGLVRRGRYLTTTFLLEVGPTTWLISIFEGQVVSITKGPFVMPSSSFALRASEQEWGKFWSLKPPPGSNDLMALIKRRALKAEGDLQIFMANLRYFKEALAKLRNEGAAV